MHHLRQRRVHYNQAVHLLDALLVQPFGTRERERTAEGSATEVAGLRGLPALDLAVVAADYGGGSVSCFIRIADVGTVETDDGDIAFHSGHLDVGGCGAAAIG